MERGCYWIFLSPKSAPCNSRATSVKSCEVNLSRISSTQNTMNPTDSRFAGRSHSRIMSPNREVRHDSQVDLPRYADRLLHVERQMSALAARSSRRKCHFPNRPPLSMQTVKTRDPVVFLMRIQHRRRQRKSGGAWRRRFRPGMRIPSRLC